MNKKNEIILVGMTMFCSDCIRPIEYPAFIDDDYVFYYVCPRCGKKFVNLEISCERLEEKKDEQE